MTMVDTQTDKPTKCSYCLNESENLIHLVFGSWYCSKKCKYALSDLLDGCSIEEVRSEWERSNS
jgi:ribosomal protein L37AE/L43A